MVFGQELDHYFKGPPDTKLAVLGDISLRVEDTYCLDGPDWLHDNLIEFYLEYLRHEKYREHKDKIEIIGPPVTQCIKLAGSPDVVSEMIDPLNLATKRVVLIPVNNSAQENAEGTHWSLLAMVPPSQVFVHIDSLDMNKDHAEQIAKVLSKHFGFKDPTYENYTKNQQSNAYDCGVYVLINARKVIEHFLETNTREGLVPEQKTNIQPFRQIILGTIKEVATAQQLATPGVTFTEGQEDVKEP